MLEIMAKIAKLIDAYFKKHPLAKKCGSEYIYQDDEAQVDAVKLTSDIIDIFAKECKAE